MHIRIAIADDHPIVTEGLRKLLSAQNHFEVIATYGSGAALLEGLELEQPDVLLLDVYFPDTTGNELIRIISKKHPAIRVLALSNIDQVTIIKDLMLHGCSGYVFKNVALPALTEAIETVATGEEFLGPELKEHLVNSLLKPKQKQATGDLTQREQQILTLIAKGHTNKEIAKKLFLSYRTIQNNRLNLYQKFGVHNTAELIKVAIEKDLI